MLDNAEPCFYALPSLCSVYTMILVVCIVWSQMTIIIFIGWILIAKQSSFSPVGIKQDAVLIRSNYETSDQQNSESLNLTTNNPWLLSYGYAVQLPEGRQFVTISIHPTELLRMTFIIYSMG